MKTILGILLLIIGAIAGLYVGGWLMFIQSILDVCRAFDNQTLTATLIGWTIIKCVFAGFVGYLVFCIGYIPAMFLIND